MLSVEPNSTHAHQRQQGEQESITTSGVLPLWLWLYWFDDSDQPIVMNLVKLFTKLKIMVFLHKNTIKIPFYLPKYQKYDVGRKTKNVLKLFSFPRAILLRILGTPE